MKYKSKFEEDKSKEEPYKNLPYESMKLTYIDTKTYIPDWVDKENKVIYETKGRLTASDRKKMILVKKQNPDWTYVFDFQTPNNKISKKSKTTYKQWAIKNGFKVING